MADNTKKIAFLGKLVGIIFRLQEKMIKIYKINYSNPSQALFASWHGHQMSFYSLRDNLANNILISASNDGEIVARGVEALNLKVIRGSKGRKGTQATLKILEKLEQGESASITVDGPKGPKHVAKKGIINIAKISQVPIIPMVWHSDAPNFIKFNTWDDLTFPCGFIKVLVLFGEPIYVPADVDDEGIEKYRQKLEFELKELDKRLKSNYKEYLKSVK